MDRDTGKSLKSDMVSVNKPQQVTDNFQFLCFFLCFYSQPFSEFTKLGCGSWLVRSGFACGCVRSWFMVHISWPVRQMSGWLLVVFGTSAPFLTI